MNNKSNKQRSGHFVMTVTICFFLCKKGKSIKSRTKKKFKNQNEQNR